MGRRWDPSASLMVAAEVAATVGGRAVLRELLATSGPTVRGQRRSGRASLRSAHRHPLRSPTGWRGLLAACRGRRVVGAAVAVLLS